MNQRVLKMEFAKIYALLLDKVVKKGRTKGELDVVIFWLTGHDEGSLQAALSKPMSVEEFYSSYPHLHQNARLVTGSICGCKVQEISDPLEKNMRLLDKLVDELAKGKTLDKVLRKDEENL